MAIAEWGILATAGNVVKRRVWLIASCANEKKGLPLEMRQEKDNEDGESRIGYIDDQGGQVMDPVHRALRKRKKGSRASS